MKIKSVAVLGAGAVGSYVIWGLSQKPEVRLGVIAEGERADRLRKNGCANNGRIYHPEVWSPEEAHNVDLLVVALKYGSLEGTLKSIQKTTGGHKAGMIAFFVLTCLCLVLSMFVSPVIFLVPTIIFGVIWYLFAFRSEVEYEYTYYDGDLRFAKIRNKAKRKKIAYLSMDDVLTIAPKGDRSIYKYENDRSVTVKNIASGNADAKLYEAVCKGENGITRYEFEPDEDMLNAIMVKYPRSVIK